MRLELQAARLQLRRLVESDSNSLIELANVREIADTMISVPHPFLSSDAALWILESNSDPVDSCAYRLAVVKSDTDELLGCVSLRDIDREHSQAEISFWIGRPFWGKGYATEAIQAAIPFFFTGVGLNRFYAHHMTRNPAAGRVLKRVGFVEEGILRERVCKWGVYEDVVICSLLRSDVSVS